MDTYDKLNTAMTTAMIEAVAHCETLRNQPVTKECLRELEILQRWMVATEESIISLESF